MPLPTPRLAAVLALVALGVAAVPGAGLGVLVVLDALVLVAVAVDVVRSSPPDAIGVERSLPDVVALGSSDRVTWRVSSSSDRAVRVRVADSPAPSLQLSRRRVELVVPAGGAITTTADLAPGRRGDFAWDEVVVRTFGPLGLIARQATRSVPGRLRVYPPMGFATKAAALIAETRTADAGLRLARQRGGGTEFDSLRDYTPDDDPRRIDWAATARSIRPIVRTYRPEENQVVQLLLDVGRTMAGRVRDPEAPPGPAAEVPRSDHALDAALLCASVAVGMGDRAGLVAYSDRVRATVPPSGRPGHIQALLGAAYTVEPELVESDHRTGFAAALAQNRRRGLIVVFTELSTAAVEASLMGSLGLVLRRHVVVIGAVTDPRVVAWASGRVEDLASGHRRAAAIRSMDERGALVRRLRAAGAIVVDAPPAQLGGQVARTYLEVKASGRL